ncbi:hypothetical protein D9M69_552260 [compost metagenome]
MRAITAEQLVIRRLVIGQAGHQLWPPFATLGVLQGLVRQTPWQAVGPSQGLSGQAEHQDAAGASEQNLPAPGEQATLTKRGFDEFPRQITQQQRQ